MNPIIKCPCCKCTDLEDRSGTMVYLLCGTTFDYEGMYYNTDDCPEDEK